MAASGRTFPPEYVKQYTDYLIQNLLSGQTLARNNPQILACLERIANVGKKPQDALALFAPLNDQGTAGILTALRPVTPGSKISNELKAKPYRDWTREERQEAQRHIQDTPMPEAHLQSLLEEVAKDEIFKEVLTEARENLSGETPKKPKEPSSKQMTEVTLALIKKNIPEELRLLDEIRDEIQKLTTQITPLNGDTNHPTYEPIRQKLEFLQAVFREISRYSRLNDAGKAAHPLVLPTLGEAGKQNIGTGFKGLLAKIRNFFGVDSKTASLGKTAMAFRDSQRTPPSTPTTSQTTTPPESPRGPS